jgi:hypothetical protein
MQAKHYPETIPMIIAAVVVVAGIVFYILHT